MSPAGEHRLKTKEKQGEYQAREIKNPGFLFWNQMARVVNEIAG
jgi:hypothetical protein